MPKPTSTQHPWGFEIVWANEPNYSGRCLIIKDGEHTELGYNKLRDKVIFVLQGVVQLVLESQTKLVYEGESYHIPPKIIHQICALKGDATIIESGSKLTEDFIGVK